jgi:uncharacterized protein YhbP (UPF0306 family)
MFLIHQRQKTKRILVVAPILPCLLALGGCFEKPVLECHDPQATDLVKKGVKSAFQKSVGSDAKYDEYFDFKMENPVVVSYDKEVRKRNCQMLLTVAVKPTAIEWTNNVFKMFEPKPFNLEQLAINDARFKDAYAAYIAIGGKAIDKSQFTGPVNYANQMQSGSESQFVTSWQVALAGADQILLTGIASVVKLGSEEQKLKTTHKNNSNQAAVTVTAYGFCPDSDEAVCVGTDQGSFTANAFALTDEQKQLLTASLMEKKSVCLMNLEAVSGTEKSFESVSARCN